MFDKFEKNLAERIKNREGGKLYNKIIVDLALKEMAIGNERVFDKIGEKCKDSWYLNAPALAAHRITRNIIAVGCIAAMTAVLTACQYVYDKKQQEKQLQTERENVKRNLDVPSDPEEFNRYVEHLLNGGR